MKRIFLKPSQIRDLLAGKTVEYLVPAKMIEDAGRRFEWVENSPINVRDVFWVAESYCFVSPDENRRPPHECNIEYRADTDWKSLPGDWSEAPDDPEALKWSGPATMPKWASRLSVMVKEKKLASSVESLFWVLTLERIKENG